MSLGEDLYRLALGGLRTVAPLVARGPSKLARGVRARRDAAGHLIEWTRSERDGTRPLVWFHAPSVGEGLQARAVLEALLAERDDLQAVFTFFSPSAEGLARRMPVPVSGYLPWDLPGEVGPVLDALTPDLLVFTKTEVWPLLSREAARRGVPMALVAGTLPESAGRLRWPARTFLRPSFGRLARVGAISEEDGRRFGRLGVTGERVVVTGDPAIDSAWERARAADPDAPHLRPFRDDPRPTVVAGSTWGPDEAVLLPALARVREEVSDVRMIVAPHEPSPEHVGALLGHLESGGWRAALLSEVVGAEEAESAGAGSAAGKSESRAAADTDAVVVDSVGVLADLYTVGTVAFVGGGFHGQGLHSVLEPAAAGLPVTFGPAHERRDASDLLARGGARQVADTGELASVLSRWLTDEGDLERTSGAAFGYIEQHRGAAARSVTLLQELLPPA